MRLADVKWIMNKVHGFDECWVRNRDGGTFQIAGPEPGTPTYDYYKHPYNDGDGCIRIGHTPLELACWLADKEPCDAPDPHPDY
jgi:hypothetical protein